jgi:hypothetical protein
VSIYQTIVAKDIPNSIIYTYEAYYVPHGRMNLLDVQNEGESSELIYDNEIKFTGLMRLFGWMTRAMLKRNGMRSLQKLKQYTENLEANTQVGKPNPKGI